MIKWILLFLGGIVAGFINTLAGGGSLITLPILLFGGLPSPMANATNRVAILCQNVVGSSRFYRYGKLPIKANVSIVFAAVLGAIIGSVTAVQLSSRVFDIILGLVLFSLLLRMIFLKDAAKIQRLSVPYWGKLFLFFLIGWYGGFIQAGVGFILLGALTGIQGYDLVHANAVKVFIIMSYTAFAVLVFSFSGTIDWGQGFVLSAGTMIGAWIGVKVAITRGVGFVRIIVAIAVVAACLKLFGIFSV